MDEYLSVILSTFTVDSSDVGDPALKCQCGDTVCTIEHGDTIETLVNVCTSHAEACAEFLPEK